VPLTHSLFSVRARVVTGNLPPEQARSFISGLLIGAEFVASAPAADGLLTIIGSPELARRYQDAAAFFGQRTQTIDPDRAYCAALARFLPAQVAP
jgi:2-dehydro-3-deoxygalactonokinase